MANRIHVYYVFTLFIILFIYTKVDCRWFGLSRREIPTPKISYGFRFPKSRSATLVKATLTNNEQPVDVSICSSIEENREISFTKERAVCPFCPFRLHPRGHFASALARERRTMAPPNIYFFPSTVSLNSGDNLVNRHNGVGRENDFLTLEKVKRHPFQDARFCPSNFPGNGSNFLISFHGSRERIFCQE